VTELVRVTEMSDIIIASAGMSGGRDYDILILLIHNNCNIAARSRPISIVARGQCRWRRRRQWRVGVCRAGCMVGQGDPRKNRHENE